MAACGIAPEDDDGNAGSKPVQKREPVTLTDNTVSDFLTTISDAKDMDSLKKAFSVAYKAAEHVSDAKAQAKFEQAKDQRKTAIQNEITSQA